jgi:hypothetical protein
MRLITKLWATLLLLCVAGVANAATEYEVDQKFTTIAELDGKSFAIVDETPTTPTAMGIGISGHGNGWDMYFGTITEAYNSNTCFYKLEAVTTEGLEGNYYLRTYKADGTMYTAWGDATNMGYFNSQPATGGCCFALGLSSQNGQDGPNLAVWKIEVSEGKFALKNIGTGQYLHADNLPAKYDDAFYFTFCTLKEKAQTDPLADQKDALTAAIAKGKMFNALAYTDATFTTLTTKIADGETALAAEGATAESLTAATTAINDAITALAFKEGFSSLKDVPFGKWNGWGADAQQTSTYNTTWELFKTTGQSYGDPGVNDYADLSAFDKLYVTVASGTPRILLNRDADNGQWNATEAESHLIDNTVGDADSWHQKYFAKEGNVYSVDLKQLTTDKGFAHLHSIKSRDNNVVTGLFLYKAPAAAVTTEVTFDFDGGNHAASSNSSHDGDITEDEILTQDGVTMTITPSGGSTANRYWGSSPKMRMYGGTMTIVAPEGKAITKVVYNNGKWNTANTINGIVAENGEWTGNSTNVVLSVSANTQIKNVIVTVADKNDETTTFTPAEPVHIANTAETAYTVAEAIALIDAGEALNETVFVKGIISKIEKVNVDAEDATKNYITYWISADGTEEGQQFECFKGLTMEGVAYTDIKVGATVIVKGTMKKYVKEGQDDIYEFNQNNELVSYEVTEVPVDPASLNNVAKKAEMSGEISSLEDLKNAKFMLQNKDGLVLYTPDGWDVKVADIITATSNKANGGFFSLVALDGDHEGQYQVPIWNLDGTRRTYWAGEQYLNSQPVGGNVIFGLSGTSPQYGQDGPNLALWTISHEEGNGFAFHCVGRDVYLGNDAAAARPVDAITYWKAYTGYNAGYDEAEILAAYKAVASVIKTTSDAATLSTAKSTYDTDKDLNKFGDAVNAAISVVKACVALNETYGNLDATGAAVATEVLAKYNAGEFASVAELQNAYYAAAKAQTTAGANMTLAIVNPSFEDGTINGWTSTNGGDVANNLNFAARTGNKFCERWTAAPGALTDGTFLQTITGLPNGKYVLTAELQNREQGNNDAAGKGFFLVANEGQTEGITNDGQTIETTGVVTDGTLVIGVKLEGCTGNWVCFDNFQLTYKGEAASETELAALTAEIEIAKTLGVVVTEYENGVFTAEEVTPAVEKLKVAEYTQVNKDYTVNAAILIPDFSQWEGEMISNKGQHWDGTSTSTYYEQTGAQWSQSSWTNNKKTTVKLPKGKYVLYAAGRASVEACTAYIKVNDITRNFPSKSDVGFGVATDGTASFDPTATYANGGKGRGFEYRYIAFEVTADEGEDISLEIGGEATAEHQWMSVTSPVLVTTDDNAAILLPVLKGKLTIAKADLDAIGGTVGNAIFQKPQAAYDDYANAVSAAEELVGEGANPSADDIKNALAAIEDKANAFANAPVNAPVAEKLYTFQLRLGGETPLYMNLSDEGEVGRISIAEKATALKFIAAEGAEGQYELANEDATLFVGLAGTNNWTMSALPEKKAVWTFTALPNGAYRINNLVTAGRFVGTNAADKTAGTSCYADKQEKNGNVDWIITEYVAPAPPHTWDFTKWSEATVANLKAEAAKVTVSADPDKEGNTLCEDNGALWSDHEKKPGTTCDTYAASKDNCFWYVGGEATPTANGTAIAEFAGLQFNTAYGASRALAIAVNYPSTSIGTYNGPSYLWFGGKGQTIMTIPAVKGGSTIKIGVESHKSSEARGIQLFSGETELKDADGNAVAAPKTYTEQTWVVPAGVAYDIVVKNTNGCHIYFIDAEQDENTLTSINTVKSNVMNNAIYNLNGQKVNKAQKGLFIINGKKVVK